ncbi:peptidase inhibitor family I36 protein [Streptomyces sp. NPDC000410]|uniref:peptidase inhibitor family I36 protein n=1 Tax=Streptomyces sp. NPDC000410 TaxID=3154254 RepID=UPI00332219ED
MQFKRFAAVGATVLAIAGAGLATAAPANAAAGCPSQAACLFYNSDFEGAIFSQTGGIANYDGYKFVTSAYPNGGSGAGQGVKNNAASVNNNNTSKSFRVYYNSNYGTSYAYQTFGAWTAGNLNSTMKNNNASGRFI